MVNYPKFSSCTPISKYLLPNFNVGSYETDIHKELNMSGLTEKGSINKPVYCICHKEEKPGMLGCDHCDEWYHIECLALSKNEARRLTKENWCCPKCKIKKGACKFPNSRVSQVEYWVPH